MLEYGAEYSIVRTAFAIVGREFPSCFLTNCQIFLLAIVRSPRNHESTSGFIIGNSEYKNNFPKKSTKKTKQIYYCRPPLPIA
jgi:hypothetical protein